MHAVFQLIVLSSCLAALPAIEKSPDRPVDTGKAVDQVVSKLIEKHTLPGVSVAIAVGDDIKLSRGWGFADLENDVPAGPKTVYRIGSITKQFTAALIMKQVEAGKLKLDDPLTKFLADYPTQGNVVTVHHLLNHTSGIQSFTSVRPLIDPRYRLDLRPDDVLKIFQDKPFDFKPGTEFRYNNSGYYLLGLVLEKVTDKKYRRLLRDEIIRPLKLESTYYGENARIIKHRAEGYRSLFSATLNDNYVSMKQPYSAGAMLSTTEDLIRWQRALVTGKVVKPESYNLMTSPTELPGDKKAPYGYGLSVGKVDGKRVVRHGGGINGFRSSLVYFPEQEVSLVILVNHESAPMGEFARQLAKIAIDAAD